MAFIIDKKGNRIPVDVDVEWFNQNCVLYADDADLRECFVLNLYKGKNGSNYDGREPELIKQIEYWDEPPTKDQIMYEMWKQGLSRYDIATVEKGYMLDWK